MEAEYGRRLGNGTSTEKEMEDGGLKSKNKTWGENGRQEIPMENHMIICS